jgi:hypothetical protein
VACPLKYIDRQAEHTTPDTENIYKQIEIITGIQDIQTHTKHRTHICNHDKYIGHLKVT